MSVEHGPLANGNAHVYSADQKICLIITTYNRVIIRHEATARKRSRPVLHAIAESRPRKFQLRSSMSFC